MEETSTDTDKMSESKTLLLLTLLNFIALSDIHNRFSEEEFKKTVEIIKTRPYASVVDYLIT